MIVNNCRNLDNCSLKISTRVLMLYEYNAIKDKCPLALVKLRLILKKMQENDICQLKIADQGSKKDIPALLTKQGYDFSVKQLDDRVIELYIKIGN